MLLRCYPFILYCVSTFTIVTAFSNDQTNFDAYGLKLAANDVFFVEALPAHYSFLLRHAPFNYSLTCTLDYNDTNQYVYAVAVPRLMHINDTVQFLFIGVDTLTKIPFIATINYTGISGPDYVATLASSQNSKFPCDGWNMANYMIYSLDQFLDQTIIAGGNIDFYVLTVEPNGQQAYAFANKFLVSFNLKTNNISTQLGNLTWPDTSFLPRAVDISQDVFIVVLGFVAYSNSKYIPCAYLIARSQSNLTVVDTWMYTPPSNNSWQAGLTNWDAQTYSAKYDMSVSFNDVKNQVLIGIPITNTITLLGINRATRKFVLSAPALSNGKAIGMGKAVGWLNANTAVVLVNTYSLSYIWSSSRVVTYSVDSTQGFTVRSIMPNSQQALAPLFGPTILSLVVTSNAIVVMLDSDGDTYILLPSPPGSFSDSSKSGVSSATPCAGGTFSNSSDIQPCSLCPVGTSTNGFNGQSSCTACSMNAFCPLGSAFGNVNMSSVLFVNLTRTWAYPVSPQSVRFDNILMLNMFVIQSDSSSNRCLVLSPLFWALITMALGTSIAVTIMILKHCVHHPLGKKMQTNLKRFFKHTDLVGEGELWIGGIFSFAILVFVIFAYVFSDLFFVRYPIEDVKDDAKFACDSKLMNTQFESSLMPLVISPSKEELPIFDLLNNQPFTLRIDFINTLFSCNDVSLLQKKDEYVPLVISCQQDNGVLSITTVITSHSIDLKVQLDGMDTIGGMRLSFEGPEKFQEDNSLQSSYMLREFKFSQTVFSFNNVLSQQPLFAVQLTKIINRTYPLIETGRTNFGGAWVSNMIFDSTQIFDAEYEYQTSSTTGAVILIFVSETPYYVLNTQKPIVDKAELIFTNLLFSLLCLEIFGLFFLLIKLLILPILLKLYTLFFSKLIDNHLPTEQVSEVSHSRF